MGISKTITRALLMGVLISTTLGQNINNSPGCDNPTTLTSGTKTTTIAGQQREYILTLPANYDPSTPYKLIFGLHWLSGSMFDVSTGSTISSSGDWAYYGLQALANETAIFVAPNGLDAGWANTGGRDLDFIDNLVATMTAELCVDESKIFATGFSYGGGMSYSLACSRPDVFRAVAALSGALLSGCEGGTQAVAYLGQHGLNDQVLPIDMGRQIRNTFVQNNGCDVGNPEEVSQGSGGHTKYVYEGCGDGYPVWWIAFDGGHEPAPSDGGSGVLYTPGETWDFFTQFD